MTRYRLSLSPKHIRQGKKLRAQGKRWDEVGKILGVSDTTARRYCDENYKRNKENYDKAQKKARQKRYEELKKARVVRAGPQYREPPPEVQALRFAEIPDDTRSYTARICGDPLPGRSALDRRG